MRLFKSPKTGEYSDVSSVVANGNDPHVKIVSCNSQQEFHGDEMSIQNRNDDKKSDDSDNPTTNHYFDELKTQQKNNIPYSLKAIDNSCTDKFTPIPECDQIDELANIHYESSTPHADNTTSMTATTAMNNHETKLHSDSTSDFINELFATLDNLETKLSIQDDNDSLSIDTISENVDIKSESSIHSTDGKIKFIGQNGQLPDYKVVKAIPVIVLDGDVPKESRNMFTWGRRMSKKFELLRRCDSRKVHEDGGLVRKQCPSASSIDLLSGRSMFSLKTMSKSGDELTTTNLATTKSTSTPPPTTINNYSFKTFFHRIGSTGMLSRSSNSNQSNSKQLNETRKLYRSSSTSQLNTPSYVKGDDPTDGISLCNRSKTIEAKVNTVKNNNNSKQHNHHHHHNHIKDNYLKASVKAASYDDIATVANEPKASKRSNFPYAFLRSKLSVLPEENGGSVINHKRLLLHEMQLLDNGNTVDFKTRSTIGSGQQQPQKLPHHLVEEKVENIDSNTAENLTPNGNCNLHSQSPRFTYQRFNSYFSSNESGYDSDGRHTEDQHGTKSITPKEEFNLHGRYKNIKLQRKSSTDIIGIEIVPIKSEDGHECRYIVSNLLSSGLAAADGRIYIGDEIVNVNCIDLRRMKSYEKHGAYENVQELLSTFVDDSVEFVITHDEPTTCDDRLNDRDTQFKSDLHIDYDLSARTMVHSNHIDDTNGQRMSPLEKSSIYGPMLNVNKSKNETSWSCKSSDLKPLQNYTEYVPVYGDKNKSHTVCNDERLRILGKKRIDLLSKYGYSSHRETKTTDNMSASENPHWQTTENKNITFDNCYILGETKLTPSNQFDASNKTNRHSFCEYKPFSSRKYDVPRLKFFAPMDQLIHFNQKTNSVENLLPISSTNPIETINKNLHNVLSMMGEKTSNGFVKNPIKPLPTQNMASLNEFEDMSVGPFREESTSKEKHTEKQNDLQKFIFFKAYFQKGAGMKSLGFSIVGGRDSPKGSIGIFVKTVFTSGQASDNANLLSGDEILSLNNCSLKGMSHLEVITMFKNIKEGPIILDIARRRTMRAKSLDSVQFKQN